MTTTLAPIPKSHRDSTVGFPKGWYCVAESEEVTGDEMVPVTYLGQDLIVFRDADGRARVADAFCPHLGAHLASADGCIDGGEIVCPFHKWRFSASTGRCTSIPYSESVPPRAALIMHPTIEMGGMVLMWWHPRGGEPEDPPFDGLSAYRDRTWIKHSSRTFLTQVPLRDLHENAFDTAHIQQLHGSLEVPQIASIERRPHGLEVNVAPSSDEERTQIEFLQFNFSSMSMSTLAVLGADFGVLSNNTSTPIDSENTLMTIRMFVMDTGSAEANELIGGAFADRVQLEIDQDMKVLNFKKHVERPMLCSGDGPIMQWRRYAKEVIES